MRLLRLCLLAVSSTAGFFLKDEQVEYYENLIAMGRKEAQNYKVGGDNGQFFGSQNESSHINGKFVQTIFKVINFSFQLFLKCMISSLLVLEHQAQ